MRTVDDLGNTEWKVGGKLHRDDGPAFEEFDGSRWWYQHGVLHRDDGPAIEGADGSRWWYQHGALHRDNGPAIEDPDGINEWYQHGLRHRLDGPAIEDPDGDEFFLVGRRLTAGEHAQVAALTGVDLDLALKLLPDWSGTIAELVATVQSVSE